MLIWHTIIETMFTIGLFANALLFIPQIIRLYRTKDAHAFSLITFFGFNVIQFFIILHGVLHRDILLILGDALSLTTCGTLTLLIIFYRLKQWRYNRKLASAKIFS